MAARTSVHCVITKFSGFINTLWSLAKRHVLLTSVLALLCIAFAAFSVYVGFAPMAVLLAPVALVGWWIIQRRTPKQGRAEAISIISSIGIAVVIVFAVIQAIPYGRDQSQPAITGEPKWSSPETRDLMVRACFGCHSNEVEYPSYARFAPISWSVQRHIDEGREKVNYSEFATNPEGADESVEVILDGSMPPAYYTRFGLHPDSKLTKEETQILIAGLRATPGMTESGGSGNGEED